MEGPMRFRCPPEFEAVTPSPLPGLRGEALEGPSTELWLIRAPADFSPESLEGCTVPLDSCGQLQPSRDGDGGLYRLWGVPGGAEGTLLLAPASPPAGPLACAPPPPWLPHRHQELWGPPRRPSDPPRAQAGEEEEEEDDDDDDEGATGDARGVNTRGGSTRRGGGK
ncbi:DNA-directed RNA polymerase I subunit RPA34 isoform X1 [Tyto alba]|uniref:DNA-directed RNA polymerase I subunit RPA34 isoform X1 n=1 Tax=Tyto alba TaxID=56313 RepID=UPI001C681114|nr:DNA-directed RNA polymerase I subunit RPA34 isoform X1 [Tyto alba]